MREEKVEMSLGYQSAQVMSAGIEVKSAEGRPIDPLVPGSTQDMDASAKQLLNSVHHPDANTIRALATEVEELRTEVDRLRTERDGLRTERYGLLHIAARLAYSEDGA